MHSVCHFREGWRWDLSSPICKHWMHFFYFINAENELKEKKQMGICLDRRNHYQRQSFTVVFGLYGLDDIHHFALLLDFGYSIGRNQIISNN